MTANIQITRDNTKKVLESLRRLAKERVLVGIPDKTAGREHEDGAPISNAVIGYIQEHGSPAANIPARPHLVPGVQDALPRILTDYKASARAMLNGNLDAIDAAHNRVGLIAQAAVRSKITKGPFEPLSPVTLKKRKTRKVAPRQGEKPLIDTGQYRQAINYVIRAAG